jgi:6-aminohexanoate-oligomer endohydrolase
VDPTSNDTASLTPITTWDGPSLAYDFPAVEVGIAEYAAGPTGCTVFHFPAGVLTAVDIRGGSPGTTGAEYSFVNAICLAGGSLYGLEAASGVAAELFARRNYSSQWDEIATVAGAIIYDFGGRANAIYPDKALGRAALRAATTGRFPLGRRGAGISATVGKGLDFLAGEPGGQGAAVRSVSGVRLAVFSVVNAVGAIVNRRGEVVRGHLDRASGRRAHILDEVEALLTRAEPARPVRGNTTLTVMVTNQRLAYPALRQIARQVHGSMARVIQPFHTVTDGDVLFAVTTNEVEHPALDAATLGVLASELAWDAVLRAVE